MAKIIYVIEEFLDLEMSLNNDGTEILTFPPECDITTITAAEFTVTDDDNVQLFQKTLGDGVEVSSTDTQTLEVEYLKADIVTLGSHKWQLDITTTKDGFSSVMAGNFCIVLPRKQV